MKKFLNELSKKPIWQPSLDSSHTDATETTLKIMVDASTRDSNKYCSHTVVAYYVESETAPQGAC